MLKVSFIGEKRFWSWWMIVMAVIHIVFSMVLYGDRYLEMLSAGLWDSATELSQKVALWFFMIGVMILLLGWCVAEMKETPKKIGYGILFLALLGVCLVPLSGFWLLFPPAIFLCLTGYRKNRYREE